jgi:hypothetical protein
MSRFQVPLLALLSLCAVSCSSDESRKTVYPVKGQVLFQGKPAAGAMVILHPVDASEANPERPLGYADENGNFQLTTYTTHDGAPEGQYAVSAVWMKPAEQADMSQAATQSTPAASPNLLPARYADAASSGLTVQIQEGVNELQPFQLKR